MIKYIQDVILTIYKCTSSMVLGMFILGMLHLYAFQSLYSIWLLISYFCALSVYSKKFSKVDSRNMSADLSNRGFIKKWQLMEMLRDQRSRSSLRNTLFSLYAKEVVSSSVLWPGLFCVSLGAVEWGTLVFVSGPTGVIS